MIMVYSVLQFLSRSTTPGQSLHGVMINISAHLEVALGVSILLSALAVREIATIKKC